MSSQENTPSHNSISYFENIWKAVTQLSILVLVFGVVKAVLFYKAFDIPVQYFLSISEISMFVSSNFIYIAVFLFAISCFYLLILQILYFYVSKKREIKSQAEFRNEVNVLFIRIIGFILKGIFIISIFLVIFSIILFIRYKNPENVLAIISFFVFFFYMFVNYLYGFSIVSNPEISPNRVVFFVCSIFLTIIVISTAIEVNQLKNGKFKGSTVEFNKGEIIHINDSLILVGKSQDYVFLYNRIRERAIVYPASSVSKIEIEWNKPDLFFFWYGAK